MKSKRKYVCKHHPERIAAVDSHNEYLCWECRLGKKMFEKKFAQAFYKPDGPGHAGEGGGND